MVLNSKVEIRDSPIHGVGLFATDVIEEGEHIWWCSPDEKKDSQQAFTRQQILSHPADKRDILIRLGYMDDDDLYISTTDPFEDASFLLNHSCDPNSWFQGDDLIVARKRIEEGEEITYDYGTSESEMSFHVGMVCMCQSKNCRGTLTGDEYRRRPFYLTYQGHMTSYIDRKSKSLSWHNPKVYVRRFTDRSNPGMHKGVYAAKKVFKGERIGVFVGKVVSLQELLEYPPAWLAFSLQVHEDLFQVPADPFGPGDVPDFINHCCDANCGMEDSTVIVALRDIAEGEEISIDYGTINSGIIHLEGDNFECACNSPKCRGKVTSTDFMLKSVQESYGKYFSTYLRSKIGQAQASS